MGWSMRARHGQNRGRVMVDRSWQIIGAEWEGLPWGCPTQEMLTAMPHESTDELCAHPAHLLRLRSAQRTVFGQNAVVHACCGASFACGGGGDGAPLVLVARSHRARVAVQVNPEMEKAAAELAGIIADLGSTQEAAAPTRGADAPLPLTAAAADTAGATSAGAAEGAPTPASVQAASVASGEPGGAGRQRGVDTESGGAGSGASEDEDEGGDSDLELRVDSGDDDLDTSEDEEESEDEGSDDEEDQETQFHLDQV